MHRPTNRLLIWSGFAAAIGALLHVAAIFGGPAWLEFLGATKPVLRMAEDGHWYPAFVCLLAAAVLSACACYALSGAGLIRRLPLLKTALALISAALLLHGIGFIPLVLLEPEMMLGVYDGNGVNATLVVTSAICSVMGLGYARGLLKLRKESTNETRLGSDALGAA